MSKVIVLFVTIVFIQCNNKIDYQEKQKQANSYSNESKIFSDSSVCDKINSSSVYTVNVDKNGQEYLIKGDSIKYFSNNIDNLIYNLNHHFPIQISKVRISLDTLFVRFINSSFYTQKMGDTYAEEYMACLVFTLTENSTFKYIDVGFDTGDHGGNPGLKCRDDFTSFIKCPIKAN